MSGKEQRPPKGKPWIWITRDVLGSPAWRALSINARRLLDFLMLEHMSRAGRKNGFLMAPRDQLKAFGISYGLITSAINEAKTAGLIAVKRGQGRRPSTFTLTWLPVAEAVVAVPEQEPQGYRNRNSYGRSRTGTGTATPQIKGTRSGTPYKNHLTKTGATYSVVVGAAVPEERE